MRPASGKILYAAGNLRDSKAPLDPVGPRALRATAVATGLTLGVAATAAAVRVVPWMLDPALSWAVLMPFARSLAAVTAEAALLTGWPVGWALATQSLVERGEARVLGLLGEDPRRTVLRRMAPQAGVLALALALVSVLMAREATAPGRVVNDLLRNGRASCVAAASPGTQPVPFVSASWLCGREGAPRLAGRAPVGGFVFSASEAEVSDDLRRIRLDDAHLSVRGGPTGSPPTTHVTVRSLVLRGMAPWARASALPPLLRSVVVALAALLSACAAAFATLHYRSRKAWGPIAAVLLGASGPGAALATLRALELRVPEAPGPAWLAAFGLVPVAALAAAIACAATLSRLPSSRATDS